MASSLRLVCRSFVGNNREGFPRNLVKIHEMRLNEFRNEELLVVADKACMSHSSNNPVTEDILLVRGLKPTRTKRSPDDSRNYVIPECINAGNIAGTESGSETYGWRRRRRVLRGLIARVGGGAAASASSLVRTRFGEGSGSSCHRHSTLVLHRRRSTMRSPRSTVWRTGPRRDSPIHQPSKSSRPFS